MASRVLVQLARESDNIALFQSVVEVPEKQRDAILIRLQGGGRIRQQRSGGGGGGATGSVLAQRGVRPICVRKNKDESRRKTKEEKKFCLFCFFVFLKFDIFCTNILINIFFLFLFDRLI